MTASAGRGTSGRVRTGWAPPVEFELATDHVDVLLFTGAMAVLAAHAAVDSFIAPEPGTGAATTYPQIGDTLDYGKNRMRFERVEPQRVLATRSEDGNWVWTFVLDEQDGQTRLISRNRFRLSTLTAKIGMVPMEPASLVLERKLLHGIKRRAERLAAEEKEETHV